MEARTRTRAKIIAFVLLAFAFSSISYYIMLSTGSAADLAILWMWSPGIAAILTQLVFRDSIRNLGWRPGKARFLFVGAIVPFLYACLIYGTAWMAGLGGFRRPSANLLAAIPLGFVATCLVALGEEIGWRGLLVPELVKLTTFTKTAMVTGIIWAVWHYPAILFADYHSQAPRWFDVATLTISAMGLSFFVAWLRLKSGSIWPAVLWHGTHNLFIQGVFLNMTTDTGPTEYVVDDFGLGVLVSALALGYIAWKRRSDLPHTHLHASHGTSTTPRLG